MKYESRKSGGLGSSSQYLELYQNGQYITRNADVWNLFEALSLLPAGTYEIRQPAIYITATEPVQTEVFSVDVGVINAI